MRRRIFLSLTILSFCSIGFTANVWLDNVTIPENINRISTLSELKPYLDSDPKSDPSEANMLLRLAVIKRIGQLKDHAAFEVLHQEYLKHSYEASPPSPEILPIFRKQIIDALAETDTSQCRDFIYSELDTLLKTGPRLKGTETYKRKYAWHDAYYTNMVAAILKNIYKWDDTKSKGIIESICADPKYGTVVREAAFYGKYQKELMDRKLDKDKNQIINHLFMELTGPGVGNQSDFTPDGKTTEAIRNWGIMQIIAELGPDCLPYLGYKKKEYESEKNTSKIQCIDRAIFTIQRKQLNQQIAAQKWKNIK